LEAVALRDFSEGDDPETDLPFTTSLTAIRVIVVFLVRVLSVIFAMNTKVAKLT